jgi:hypothetical protein
MLGDPLYRHVDDDPFPPFATVFRICTAHRRCTLFLFTVVVKVISSLGQRIDDVVMPSARYRFKLLPRYNLMGSHLDKEQASVR